MATNTIDATGLKCVSFKQLVELTGLSRGTLKTLLARGDGPRSIQLSSNRVGYRLMDIQAWQDSRVRD